MLNSKAKKLVTLFSIMSCMQLVGCTIPKAPVASVTPLPGPPVAQSETPFTPLLACVNSYVKTHHKNRYTIAVDHIPDLSGKYSLYNGGYTATQGAQDMAISSLSAVGFNLVERSDMSIPMFEIKAANSFLLKDTHADQNFTDPKGRTSRKITAGEIVGSDYVLAGSITEVNYNVASGGFTVSVNGIGAGWRSFWFDTALDLRLIDTKTSRITMVIPERKQMWGYENQANIFHFFGSNLVNSNAGQQVEEPAGIAVRSIIQSSAYDIAKQLYNIPDCVCAKERADAEKYLTADKPAA